MRFLIRKVKTFAKNDFSFEKRLGMDSNHRITDLQSVPLSLLGTKSDD